MNAIQNWWNTGDLGEVETSVSIDKKSIIYLAVAAIITATVIILIAKAAKKN